jgi:hypothetical protein
MCPGCGRSVPLRVEACHCGAARPNAAAPGLAAPDVPAGRRSRTRPAGALPRSTGELWRSLPLDVKALAVASALTLGGGVAWLVAVPPRPEPLPAILGTIDRVPAPPSPSASPFPMPWWRNPVRR